MNLITLVEAFFSEEMRTNLTGKMINKKILLLHEHFRSFNFFFLRYYSN